MGKAIIISGGQGGEYEVDLVRNIDRITATITKLETMAADVQTEINRILATDDHAEIPLLKIELAAIEKYIDGLKKIPEKIRATVWAADLSIGLSGEVGTMEIPDDPGGGVNIVPNGPKHNQSKYDAKRDGIVHPIMNMGPASAFFLRAIMPGIQKHKPMYRYGTITDITDGKATVAMATALDVNNLSLNQGDELSDVPFFYMTCDDAAFVVGDEVVVQFSREWSTPKIIGFKDHPRSCAEVIYIRVDDQEVVWRVSTQSFATNIPDVNGDPITFPAPLGTAQHWLDNLAVSNRNINYYWGKNYLTQGKPVSPVDSYDVTNTFPGDCDGVSALVDGTMRPVQDRNIMTLANNYGAGEEGDYTEVQTDDWMSGFPYTTAWPTYSSMLAEGYSLSYPAPRPVEDLPEWDTIDTYNWDTSMATSKAFCCPGFMPGFVGFYYGVRATNVYRLYEITYPQDPDPYNLDNPVYSDRTQDITYRLTTPIDPVMDDFLHDLSTYTEATQLDKAKSVGATRFGTSYPVMDVCSMRGLINTSRKTVIQIYALITRLTYANYTNPGSYDIIREPYKLEAIASVEALKDDIEVDGYDPNGAPETPALSQFVQGALSEGATPSTIEAEFYLWDEV